MWCIILFCMTTLRRMKTILYLTVCILTISLIVASPLFHHPQPVALTAEQKHRLNTWNENDTQNIWELSGQFEGDMVIDEEGMRNGMINTKYRWANRVLPYEVSSAFSASEKQKIVQALQIYNQKTCIKVRPRTASDKDYVYVTAESRGCFSLVGRAGGRQQLNLQRNGCLSVGTIQHEFLHALGFYHQQSASNRDDYVTILRQNIQSGHEHNFNKYSSSVVTDFGVSYDYGSVMHYGAYAFSKNGQKTIQTKNNAQIGQRNGLSAKDIQKLQKMYKC